MQNLVILNTVIQQDEQGRYSLNDLHKASGGDKKHQPANWLRLDSTRELINEIDRSSDVRSSYDNSSDLRSLKCVDSREGCNGGTYVCKELVYSYAMWISPKFHLKVIRTFDAVVSGQANYSLAHPLKLLAGLKHPEAQGIYLSMNPYNCLSVEVIPDDVVVVDPTDEYRVKQLLNKVPASMLSELIHTCTDRLVKQVVDAKTITCSKHY